MYEDIVRFFGGVVIRQQRYIEALQKDINTLKESRLEAAKGLEDANVDEETKKILQSSVSRLSISKKTFSVPLKTQKKLMQSVIKIRKLKYEALLLAMN